jgi:hypothetical protein
VTIDAACMASNGVIHSFCARSPLVGTTKNPNNAAKSGAPQT